MNWYLQAIKNYINFSGRARRREYWMFALINAFFIAVLSILDGFIGIRITSGLYSAFVLVPSVSAQFRRLHDIDKSAWWILIGLIPIVGAVILLVFAFKEGTEGENKYGNDPKRD